MGVETLFNKQKTLLPFIGQVQLRYGFSTESDNARRALKDISMSDDIPSIIKRLRRLYMDERDLNAQNMEINLIPRADEKDTTRKE